MHDSITWIGMDDHKESIVVTAVGHDSEGIKSRFETPTRCGEAGASSEDAKEDALRRRHRLQKFLLRQGRRFEGKSWTLAHWNWIRTQKFSDDNAQAVLSEYLQALEQELERIKRLNEKIEEQSRCPEIASTVAKLRTLRGVDTVTAMTLVSELVDMNRFATARELMAFAGLVPSEYSSGGKEWRGRITKTGNAHVRRVLVEAAWHYRHTPVGTGIALRKRRDGQPANVLEIARRAELRLCRKYRKMTTKGKNSRLTVVSVARELAGFVWALGRSH